MVCAVLMGYPHLVDCDSDKYVDWVWEGPLPQPEACDGVDGQERTIIATSNALDEVLDIRMSTQRHARVVRRFHRCEHSIHACMELQVLHIRVPL